MSEELHKRYLEQAFRETGLTLRGSKFQIGMAQVTYLGHTFSREGMSGGGGSKRAPAKDEAEVRQFLRLASYYRKYTDRFADMAAPLHRLTQKDTDTGRLKASLTEPPVQAYPRFDKLASTMVLQTDASNVGLGAVLEQDQRVIGSPKRRPTTV